MIRIKPRKPFDVFGAAADAMVAGCATESDWQALRIFCERFGEEIVAETLARRTPSGPGPRWWRCNLRLLVPHGIKETAEICAELGVLEAIGLGPRFDLSRHVLEVSGVVNALQSYLARVKMDDVVDAERAAAILVVHCAQVANCMGAPSPVDESA